ncbi:MAG: O-methyltransferase, partial [Limisphaerales bacterium]
MKPGPELWSAVDAFVGGLLIPSDPVLEAALDASTKAGLPPIQVSTCQGKLLQLLAQLINARNILEVGTLGGYSTIWLARALPAGGRLITLELDPKHAEVARANFDRAGVSKSIDLRVGPAIEALPKLHAERCG